MIRQKRWFAIFYMFVVTAFFSSIVIGFSQFTRERVQANQQIAFERAVLMVLPGMYNPELSQLAMHKRFEDQLSKPDKSSAGAYTLKEKGQITAYALPVSGQGFWAPIKGVIGINADKQMVTGLAFYEQRETPGLGAQIIKTSFRKQFEGKIISLVGKAISIKRPGEKIGVSDVHAVTGATQTCIRVEKIINNAIRNWQEKLEQENQ